MKRIKKLPFYIKGIMVVILVAGFVAVVTAGLRLLEERQQKPRVLKAVASLAAGLGDERYSLDKSYELLRGGKLIYSGKVSVENIEEEFLKERYRFLAPYLQNTSVDYMIRRDEAKRQADFQMKAALYGFMPVELEGYLDEKDCIIHIPGFHESYLSFSPDNMKSQYESSLLYTVLGDRFSLPEENLADYVFFGADEDTKEDKEVWSARIEETVKLAGELYREITVEKTKQKEDILWNGSYESCTVYDVTVPAKIINNFLQDGIPKNSGCSVMLEGESISLAISLNSEKRLLKIAFDGIFRINGQSVPVSTEFYPKGVDNPWDSVLLTFEFPWEDAVYGFQLVGSNEFREKSRILHSSLSMTRPYVMGIVDIDIEFDTETGEISLDFACKTLVVTTDGVFKLSKFEGEVDRPQEEAVRVFELNVFEILRFTSGLNWNFFKKQ